MPTDSSPGPSDRETDLEPDDVPAKTESPAASPDLVPFHSALRAWFAISWQVGSPAEVADELQTWVDDTDVDGFNLPYAITPGTFADVIHHLIPELQRRGVYPTEYAPGTLRQKLFGQGDRLPAEHRGASYRRTAD